MTTPGDIVRSFVGAMATRDPDAAMAFAADGIVFENVPMPLPAGSVRGRDIVRQRLAAWMVPTERTEWTIHRQIEQGDVVMHERTDAMWFPPGMFPGGDHFAMPVMAVWEVRADRIELWRDYYDMGVIPQSLGVDLAEFGRILGQSYSP
jgi:limonene-1,2-epoxide hydrolase